MVFSGMKDWRVKRMVFHPTPSDGRNQPEKIWNKGEFLLEIDSFDKNLTKAASLLSPLLSKDLFSFSFIHFDLSFVFQDHEMIDVNTSSVVQVPEVA